jgi:cell division protein FtsW
MKAILGKLHGDRVIWLVVAFLSLFSILAVYSSTGTLAYRYQAGNTEYYLVKHLIIMLMGLFLMFVAHKIKYTYYSRLSQLALFIAVPLLILTLVMGTNINEANRWLTLPVINITFQSSDFAKLALIIYIARMLTKKQDQIKDFKSAFLPIILPVIAVCAFILPANLSTAIILFSTSVVLMFIGRVSIKYIMALVALGVVLISLFMVVLLNSPDSGRLYTWKNRIENFVSDDGDRYQTDQAKIAIATGGVAGKMPGNSVQRNFLPQAYSDFIYAIIIEEYGLIGGAIVLLLYLILLFRGVRIAHRSPGTFGALLATGLTFSLVFQAMINMAVTVGLLPVTGQPLPMVSMGGTSLWFTSLAIGIILSVSRKVEELDVKEGGEYVAA